MQCTVWEIFRPNFTSKISRPLLSMRVPAGFPSPAEDYIEGSIDLSRVLIKHRLSTFYIRVIGDSMEPMIYPNDLLIVDRMPETNDKDIVVARFGNDLCVKRLRILNEGSVWLFSDNINYKPIQVGAEDDFEIWGKVLHAIKSF